MANQVRNHRSPCPTPQCQVVDADTATLLDFFDFPFPKSHGHVSTLCQHAQNGVPELVEFSRKPTIDQLQSVSFPRHRAVVCGRCNHGLFSSTY